MIVILLLSSDVRRSTSQRVMMKKYFEDSQPGVLKITDGPKRIGGMQNMNYSYMYMDYIPHQVNYTANGV